MWKFYPHLIELVIALMIDLSFTINIVYQFYMMRYYDLILQTTLKTLMTITPTQLTIAAIICWRKTAVRQNIGA